MTATATIDRPRGHGRQRRRLTMPALMAFEAATVAVFSALHLSGALHVGSGNSPSTSAGVAEAVISVVLVAGAVALARRPGGRGRRTALLAVGFAIVGFVIGLSFTVRGGDAIDLAYHATMLPVLLGTAAALVRRR
jgi:glycerol uptake facilitator-like aquaporin